MLVFSALSASSRATHRAMRLPALATLVLLLADCAHRAPDAAVPEPGWTLVWSDEFDRDGAPDPQNWTYERGFVRNQEHQWYQPENATVRNGMLVIEARRETKPNPTYVAGSTDWRRGRDSIRYTSASLTTRGLHGWRYGRFEMRAKIDVRPGMWPAFWTVGDGGRWPASGEIDIMEYYRDMLLANVAWADSSGRAAWDDSRLPLDSLAPASTRDRWAERFHVWRMDWDEQAIRLSVDGRLLNTTDLSATVNRDGTGINPLRQAHHVILNLAVGGTQGGDPSGTAFPGRYEVDWVRVYRRAP
jgi:beta-glucanase (GH16 family)